MPTLIKVFNNNTRLEFDQGTFDAWCIYFVRPDGTRVAPKDVQYFAHLQRLGERYGKERLYADFVQIYESTTAWLDPDVLSLITTIASEYAQNITNVDIILTTIYAGMVAEENKNRAILKKRIKRLGVYQVLMEGLSPEDAANFSKGRRAHEIAVDCAVRGF
ncbi:MAG: hypothetical protein AAF639_32835 [Chloroflexota bacterium]